MEQIDEKAKKKKLAALAKCMKTLAKTTKDENIIQILGQKPMNDKERFPTGYLTLDYATGGGVRRGTIGELFGPESSGKSLVCQKIASAVQKKGGLVAYVDVEQTFDPVFAQKLGVNVEELILSQPRSLQDAFNVIDGLVKAEIDLVILDSVAALVPEEELEADIGKQTIGLTARYMSQFLRRLNSVIADSQSAVLFINQVRDKVGVLYGNPEETPGGRLVA